MSRKALGPRLFKPHSNSDVYWCRFTHGGKERRINLRTKDKVEAEQKMMQVYDAIQAGADPELAKPALAAATAAMEVISGNRPNDTRDWIAVQAMRALLSSEGTKLEMGVVAEMSYRMADAMLKQRG